MFLVEKLFEKVYIWFAHSHITVKEVSSECQVVLHTKQRCPCRNSNPWAKPYPPTLSLSVFHVTRWRLVTQSCTSWRSAPHHWGAAAVRGAAACSQRADLSRTGKVWDHVDIQELAIPLWHSMTLHLQMSVYVSSPSGLTQLPLSDCRRYTSCYDCIFARDPHCAWDGAQCVDIMALTNRWVW